MSFFHHLVTFHQLVVPQPPTINQPQQVLHQNRNLLHQTRQLSLSSSQRIKDEPAVDQITKIMDQQHQALQFPNRRGSRETIVPNQLPMIDLTVTRLELQLTAVSARMKAIQSESKTATGQSNQHANSKKPFKCYYPESYL